MALVLPSYFFVPICLVIIYILCYWIGVRLIWFKIWQNAELDGEDEIDKQYYNYRRFKNWHDESIVIIKVIIVIACIITCIFPAVSLHQVYKNHVVEETTYNQYLTEYNTLNDILTSTTDVVNSEVYLRVNEYNKEVSEFKSQFNNPKWSYNFTGQFNWNELNMIDIKGES